MGAVLHNHLLLMFRCNMAECDSPELQPCSTERKLMHSCWKVR